MRKAIFNTKFEQDAKRNGQEVKVISYIGNNMYLVVFEDGELSKVYDNELDFIESESE